MGRLQRVSAQKWAKTKRGSALPGWGMSGGLALLVVFGAVVVYSLFVSSGPAAFPSTQITPTSVVPTTSVTAPQSDVGVVGPSGGINVENTSGSGTLWIDSSVAALARTAAVADLSGNWAGVSTANGFQAPVGTTYIPVTYQEIASCAAGTGSITCNVNVQAGVNNQPFVVSVMMVQPSGSGPYSVSYVGSSGA